MMWTKGTYGLIVAACLVVLGGCSNAVGPTAKFELQGATLTNSTLNKATIIDDPATGGQTGTTSFETQGPIVFVDQQEGKTTSKMTNIVPSTSFIKRPDGTEITMNSGKDTTIEMTFDAASGKQTGFKATSMASPVVAANVNQVTAYNQAIIALSADQRQTWQTIYTTYGDTIKTIAPDLFTALKAAFGVP